MWQSWHYLKKWIGLSVFLVDATCDSDSYRSEQESNLVHCQYAPILRLNHSCCVLANLLFTCVFFAANVQFKEVTAVAVQCELFSSSDLDCSI